MKTLVALIVALPEIVRLVENIQKRLDEKATKEKIKEDFEKINEAFEKQDPEILNRLFNS